MRLLFVLSLLVFGCTSPRENMEKPKSAPTKFRVLHDKPEKKTELKASSAEKSLEMKFLNLENKFEKIAEKISPDLKVQILYDCKLEMANIYQKIGELNKSESIAYGEKLAKLAKKIKEMENRYGIIVSHKIRAEGIFLAVRGALNTRTSQVSVYTLTVENLKERKAFPTIFYRVPSSVVRVEIPKIANVKEEDGIVSIIWPVGDLEKGRRKSISYSFRIDSRGDFSHELEVFFKRRSIYRTGFCIKAAYPYLSMKNEGPIGAYVGDEVEYAISITNSGGGEAKAVMLIDTLPLELKYASSKPKGNVVNSADNEIIMWELGDIAPGAQMLVRVKSKAIRAGDCRNSARLISSLRPLEACAFTKITKTVSEN